jgi:hypothetical protein
VLLYTPDPNPAFVLKTVAVVPPGIIKMLVAYVEMAGAVFVTLFTVITIVCVELLITIGVAERVADTGKLYKFEFTAAPAEPAAMVLVVAVEPKPT